MICTIVGFAVPADYRIKLKESEKKNNYLGLARQLNKLEHEGENCTYRDWCFWYRSYKINKGTGGLGD